MQKIRITKRFNFEMAHALTGYDGLCKNIHGHSYVLWVTLRGIPSTEEGNPKKGMVVDFSEINKVIKKHIISVFDHALLINGQTPGVDKALLRSFSERTIMVDYQPTCENLLLDFSVRIRSVLNNDMELYSLKLQETETSYAEWFAEDNQPV